MHKKLTHMLETLLCVIEMQLCDLDSVDTKELGEAIDMVKDLEEAMYYCTVIEAMHGKDYEVEWEMKKSDSHHGEKHDESRMYYDGGGRRMPMTHNPWNDHESSNHLKEKPYMDNGHDERDGHSYLNRRMYMEAREMNKDKTSQLRELEKYMQELSSDVVDMISDASPEEKQYLEKKISALAQKVGQMK